MDLLEAIFALLRAVLTAVAEKSEDALLDRAYGCFGFLGLVTMSFGIAALLSQFGLVNFDEGSHGFGWTLVGPMLLGPLLLVGMLFASVCGIVLTVKFWRHSALVVLSVVSIVCVGGAMIYISHSDAPNLPHLSRQCSGHRSRNLYSRQHPITGVVVCHGQTALQKQGARSGINFRWSYQDRCLGARHYVITVEISKREVRKSKEEGRFMAARAACPCYAICRR